MGDPAIEMFRCLLMFGIVLLHCLAMLHCCSWAEGLLLPCVCGFVLISGWFGIKFKFSKIVRLYGVQLYCCVVYFLIFGVVSKDMFMSALKIMGGCWFIHAYVLMMLLSPLLDLALECIVDQSNKRMKKGIEAILPFLFAVFVWGYMMNFGGYKRFFPQTAGLNMYTGLTLLGIYCVGRLVRILHIFDLFSRHQMLVVFCGLLLGIVLGLNKIFGFYNSMIAVAFAVIVLWGVVSLNRGPRLFVVLAPSMLSVYILHMSGGDLYGIPRMVAIANDFGSPVVAAFIGFSSCIVLDIPRRLVAPWLVPLVKPVDFYFEKMVDDIANICKRINK